MWNWKKTKLSLGLCLWAVSLQAGQGFFLFSPSSEQLLKVNPGPHRTRVELLETGGMTPLSQLELMGPAPLAVAYSPDGKRILIANAEQLRVYSTTDGELKLIFAQDKPPATPFKEAVFGREGDEVIASTGREVLRLRFADPEQPDQTLWKADPKFPSAKGLVALQDQRLVIGQEGSKDLTLIHEATPDKPEILKGHQADLIGAASPDGKTLFSLDEHDKLVLWNLRKKKIEQEQKLAGEPGMRPVALSSDETGETLLVKYEGAGQTWGKAYSIKSLEQHQPQAKEVALAQGGSQLFVAFETQEVAAASRPAPEAAPNYYELARIEAESKNYPQALDFIELVPLTSPDFGKSRKLQRSIYDDMALDAALKGAIEQYRQGSLDSAQVLIQGVLAQDPANPTALHYLELIEGRDQQAWLLETGFWLLLALLLGLIGYLWHKRKKGGPVLAKALGRGRNARQEFVAQLGQVKNQLQKAIAFDKRREYTANWQAIKTQVDLLEHKSHTPLADYPLLTADAGKLRNELALRLETLQSGKRGERPGQTKSEPKPDPGRKEQTASAAQDRAKTHAAPKQGPAPGPFDPTDFYAVLGVSPAATQDEVKKAYKKKLKEYHPDKHHQSKYDWVKEEAEKMTRFVAQAYEVLKDPKARKAYDERRKK